MQWLQEYRHETEASLMSYFSDFPLQQADEPELRLFEAAKYGVLGVGKLFRPIFALLVFDTVCRTGKNKIRQQAINVFRSLEFIHASSLIHDDLPSLDNDQIRRGKPTVWKKYGEASAIFAGNTLNMMAFENIAQTAPAHLIAPLVTTLAQHSGINGINGGQMRDVYYEKHPYQLAQLIETHHKKTGCLIEAAARFGTIMGDANQTESKLMQMYAAYLGLAFQIKDDLLDKEGNIETVGKQVNKDSSKGYIPLLGIEGTRAELEKTKNLAISTAEKIGSQKLIELANYATNREK